MTAKEALLLYKSRDSSEKLFSADKTFTGSRAERIQTERSLRSKVFIEFIALIIRSLIYGRICEHVEAVGIRRNYMNVVSVISELEKMEMVRTGDGVYRIDHAITAKISVPISHFHSPYGYQARITYIPQNRFIIKLILPEYLVVLQTVAQIDSAHL
ncbi:MAG: hypothetical protein WCQ66_01530 [Sphaerochaetaceae bacterium]|jgi:hypothetical protein